MSRTRRTVVIIGGGITGLSAAFYLLNGPESPPELVLVERSNRLGGKIQTERRDGFLIETGPESFVSYKPAGIALCKAIGMDQELMDPIPANRKTFILHQGRLVRMPEGVLSIFSQPLPKLAFTLLFTRLFSWKGKLRVGLEPFVAKRAGKDDESIRSFFTRRLGDEFFTNLLDPLLSGVYGGDAGNLSMKTVMPPFYEAEKKFGSLFRAAASSGIRKKEGNKSVFVAPRDGLGSLIDKLANSIRSAQIRLKTECVRINPKPGEMEIVLENGERIKGDAVIVATPSFAAAQLVGGFDPALAEALASIPYASSTVFTFGFHQSDIGRPLNGYGFLVPKQEGLPMTACTWSSSKWENRAPPGCVLLRCYTGELETDAEKTQERILQALKSLLNIQGEPFLSLAHPHPKSMPQYTVGCEARLLTISTLQKRHAGLFVEGAALGGVGIPDCIQSGRSAAERVLTHLREQDSIPDAKKAET